MKVLLINKFFFLNGGSETVFFQERNFLRSQGHPVVDFSMDHPRNLASRYADYFVPNVEYRHNGGHGGTPRLWEKLRTAARLVHNSDAVRNLDALIRKEKPDIAHLHNIYHQLTPAIIPVLKKANVKTVMTLHDYKLICPTYLMIHHDRVCESCAEGRFASACFRRCRGGSLAQSALLSLEAYWHKWRRSYEAVDLFLSPSRFLADRVGACRIERSKIRVLRNGIDTKDYQPLDEDRAYILYFGRISREKGVEVLLDAYRRLLAEHKRTTATPPALKILGDGPLAERLAAGYPEAHFLGYRSGEALKHIIRRCSFVVVPSQWYENCSMTVLESMAFGKPVIASRIGGIPEQVDHGKTGFLFGSGCVQELKKYMETLAASPDLRFTMGKAARAKVEREYSMDSHCAELLRIYTRLLAGA